MRPKPTNALMRFKMRHPSIVNITFAGEVVLHLHSGVKFRGRTATEAMRRFEADRKAGKYWKFMRGKLDV